MDFNSSSYFFFKAILSSLPFEFASIYLPMTSQLIVFCKLFLKYVKSFSDL